jgi:hypothetical protein
VEADAPPLGDEAAEEAGPEEAGGGEVAGTGAGLEAVHAIARVNRTPHATRALRAGPTRPTLLQLAERHACAG